MAAIALITGASSGMGREMAVLLSQKNSHLKEIWLVARREDRLLALSAKLSKQCGGRCRFRVLPLDLTNPEALSELSGMLAREKPEILFLVNAAGYGKLGTVEALPEETQRGMIRLNTEVLTALTKRCLPYMKNRTGRILQFASAAAFFPQPQFAVYAATKAYVLHFSEALFEELRPRGIAVTAVCPGPVRTEFFRIAEERCSVPLYKRLFYADAEKVCRKALHDSIRRRKRSVYGISMRGFFVLARLLPEDVLFFAMRLLNAAPNYCGNNRFANVCCGQRRKEGSGCGS